MFVLHKNLLRRMSVKINLRRILSVFLLAIALLIVNAFTYEKSFQATAQESQPIPDYSYQLKLTADNIKEATHKNGEFLPDNAMQNVEKKVDKLRDNINLDNPVSQGAKNFLNEAKAKTSEVLGATENEG